MTEARRASYLEVCRAGIIHGATVTITRKKSEKITEAT